MTDRELLESAAKVAGLDLPHYVPYGVDDWVREWNPLTDDGDALRLAVKLKIDLEFQRGSGVEAYRNCNHDGADEPANCAAEDGPDPYAATRRAIVRAAAAMGQA